MMEIWVKDHFVRHYESYYNRNIELCRVDIYKRSMRLHNISISRKYDDKHYEI